MQKRSGDAAVASFRQTALSPPQTPKSRPGKRSQSQVNFAKQGNQGRVQRQSRRSLHAGKVPNGVRWKNLLRHYKPSPPPDGKLVPSFILWSWRRDSNPRPSDYKSDALPTELRQQISGTIAPSRKPIPLIPCECSGTTVKGTTRGSTRASKGSAKRLLLRAVHAGGQATNHSLRAGSRQASPTGQPHRPTATRNSTAAKSDHPGRAARRRSLAGSFAPELHRRLLRRFFSALGTSRTLPPRSTQPGSRSD